MQLTFPIFKFCFTSGLSGIKLWSTSFLLVPIKKSQSKRRENINTVETRRVRGHEGTHTPTSKSVWGGGELCTPTYFGNKAEFLAWKPKMLKLTYPLTKVAPTFRFPKMLVPTCCQEAFPHFPIHSYASAVLCSNLTSLQEYESRNRSFLR